MEKALILITLKLEYSSNLVTQFKNIKGVLDAELIYGPYDAYVTVETKSKEDLRNAAIQIRQLFGIFNTLTCNVIP